MVPCHHDKVDLNSFSKNLFIIIMIIVILFSKIKAMSASKSSSRDIRTLFGI